MVDNPEQIPFPLSSTTGELADAREITVDQATRRGSFQSVPAGRISVQDLLATLADADLGGTGNSQYSISRALPSQETLDEIINVLGNQGMWIVATNQQSGDNRTGVNIRTLNTNVVDAAGNALPTAATDSANIRLAGGTVVRIFSNTDIRVVGTIAGLSPGERGRIPTELEDRFLGTVEGDVPTRLDEVTGAQIGWATNNMVATNFKDTPLQLSGDTGAVFLQINTTGVTDTTDLDINIYDQNGNRRQSIAYTSFATLSGQVAQYNTSVRLHALDTVRTERVVQLTGQETFTQTDAYLPPIPADYVTRAMLTGELRRDIDDVIQSSLPDALATFAAQLATMLDMTAEPMSLANEAVLFKAGAPTSVPADYVTEVSSSVGFNVTGAFTIGIRTDAHFDLTQFFTATPTGEEFSGPLAESETGLTGYQLYTGSKTTTFAVQLYGRRHTVTELTVGELFKIASDNLELALYNAIFNSTPHTDPTPPYMLPAPLQALNNGARVNHIMTTDWRSANPDASPFVEVLTAFAVLKNQPALGAAYPISAEDFVNEIGQSRGRDNLVTVVPPTELGTVYIPQTVDGQLQNGVETFTNGALRGPGIVADTFDVRPPDSSNYHLVIGGWFDLFRATPGTETRLLAIKELGSDNYRPVIDITHNQTNNVLTFRRSNQDGSITNRTVTHTLYGIDGVLTHIFSGTADQSEAWRVYEARTYTINARLITTGGADLGSTTFDYPIADVNVSQPETTETLSFTTTEAGTHTQDVRISYVASTSTYGGPGHTLRIEIDQLTDNDLLDIDHILMSVTYETTENTTHANTYTSVPFSLGPDPAEIQPGKLHKFIASFRANAQSMLEILITFYGYDSGGRAMVFDENIVDLNYSVFDLDWSRLRVGGAATVLQNVQGFTLPTDLPVAHSPSHAVLNDWLSNHDSKEDDYCWDTVAAPGGDVDAVYFPEAVSFENQIVPSPDGTRYKLEATDAGLPALRNFVTDELVGPGGGSTPVVPVQTFTQAASVTVSLPAGRTLADYTTVSVSFTTLNTGADPALPVPDTDNNNIRVHTSILTVALAAALTANPSSSTSVLLGATGRGATNIGCRINGAALTASTLTMALMDVNGPTALGNQHGVIENVWLH